MEIERDREMEELGGLRAQNGVRAGVPARLSRQYRHPFDIPCHRDQVPLSSHRAQPTQQELAEAHHRFDDAKHRLDCLLTQAIELASLNGLEAVLHPIHRAGRLGQCRRFGESILPVRVMSIAPRSKQGCDLRLDTMLDVGRAEAVSVKQVVASISCGFRFCDVAG